MSRIAADLRAIGTYNHGTGVITITSNINGFATPTEACTDGNYGANPEGVNFYIKVVKKDAVIDADNINSSLVDWERGEWSYSNTAGTITFTRQTTEASYAANAAVDFGADEVEVYGAISPLLYNPSDVRTLQDDIFIDGTDFTNSSTATDADLSAELLITQNDPNSELSVLYTGFGSIRRTASTADDMRAILSLYYFDGSSWVAFGNARLFGYENSGVNNAGAFFSTSSFSGVFDSTNLNGAGQWQIRVRGRCSYADNLVTMGDTQFIYREILKP